MRFSIGNTLLCLTCVCLATAWYVDHFKQEPIVGSWRLYADPRAPPIPKFTSEISEICLLSDGKLKITQAALPSGGSEFLGTWTENQDGFIHCHIVSAKDLEESNLRRPADFSFRFAPLKNGGMLLLRSGFIDSESSSLDSESSSLSWLDSLEPSNIPLGVYFRHDGG